MDEIYKELGKISSEKKMSILEMDKREHEATFENAAFLTKGVVNAKFYSIFTIKDSNFGMLINITPEQYEEILTVENTRESPKYNIKVKVETYKEEGRNANMTLLEAKKIEPKNIETNEKVKKLLSEKPFLVGFAGFKEDINYPIVFNDVITENNFVIKKENRMKEGNEFFVKKIEIVNCSNLNFDRKSFYISRHLFNENKMFLNYIKKTSFPDIAPTDFNTVPLEKHTIIEIIISEFESLESPKNKTLVNMQIADKYKKDIETLIKSEPISIKEFEDFNGSKIANMQSVFILEKQEIPETKYFRILVHKNKYFDFSSMYELNAGFMSLALVNNYETKEEFVEQLKKNLGKEININDIIKRYFKIEKRNATNENRKEAMSIIYKLEENNILSYSHENDKIILNENVLNMFEEWWSSKNDEHEKQWFYNRHGNWVWKTKEFT